MSQHTTRLRSMAENEKTIAARRWPGWRIDGDGRFAVADMETGVVHLFIFVMEAQQFARQRIGVRKIYLLDRVPEPQPSTRHPGDWED